MYVALGLVTCKILRTKLQKKKPIKTFSLTQTHRLKIKGKRKKVEKRETQKCRKHLKNIGNQS